MIALWRSSANTLQDGASYWTDGVFGTGSANFAPCWAMWQRATGRLELGPSPGRLSLLVSERWFPLLRSFPLAAALSVPKDPNEASLSAR